MKLSGREFLRSISEFFGQTNYEIEMLLLLLFPIILLIVFFYYFNSRRASANLFDSIPAKDMEFIETVRLQKGLEEFDRDFLLELALTHHVKPGYIFIDIEVFTKTENSLKISLIEAGEAPEKNTRYQHLLKLKTKLFKNI